MEVFFSFGKDRCWRVFVCINTEIQSQRGYYVRVRQFGSYQTHVYKKMFCCTWIWVRLTARRTYLCISADALSCTSTSTPKQRIRHRATTAQILPIRRYACSTMYCSIGTFLPIYILNFDVSKVSMHIRIKSLLSCLNTVLRLCLIFFCETAGVLITAFKTIWLAGIICHLMHI